MPATIHTSMREELVTIAKAAGFSQDVVAAVLSGAVILDVRSRAC